MIMWIARDKHGLWLFHEKPMYDGFLEEWYTPNADNYGSLPEEDFPEVTIENSPFEIELNLKQ
jgi:hypothetical protein